MIVFIVLLIFFISTTLIANYINSANLVTIPPDFYGTSKEVDINEFETFLNESNISIYLPTIIPNELNLTAIYLMENPFIAIVVYSAESNKDYKTAELNVQISMAYHVPNYDELVSNIQNPEIETALEINTWPVLVNEKASTGGDSSAIAKWGEYTVIAMSWIQNNEYLINCPIFTFSDVVTLVENMQPFC
jgi:hypothetical protein